MKIASWNVNSVKVRLPRLMDYLKDYAPDVLCLQELKVIDENFPRLEVEELGYHVETHGQKTYNGVALLSKFPLEDIRRGLPGDDADEQARYMEATVQGIRIASIYLPNGNPVDSDKFPYKLGWMERLITHAKGLLESEMPVVLAGDYNIIPQDEDCYDPKAWEGDALTRPESRNRFRQLLNMGYTDAYRAYTTDVNYTYWDYQRGAWQKDHGIRIDHLLLSPQATDRMGKVGIDKGPRGQDKPSDHTPIWVEIEG
ncbi:MAG: exodeoxyribonuclease III [Sneathiella sp.]|jgi:exodeoxyribonuclease-3|uniref:exodeoxyribonuclease III n=1 Tax=Sneathiella sp. TaxID=1964365 RepID=UPI000C3CAE3B|nr:exodeoxyribonuclease III [Sneathiella sp.]MAL80181.1 exodeoxyribonuclease III [Sneathiella sp.]|tara:strand:+ start:310 stop:1077 length:768 start_codon:yes stop_codon:yes gene_type:complete